MAKPAPKPITTADISKFCKSTFTLTFAIEILDVDVWHDCNEGWLDLGPCVQGMKIQYQLYPGQSFDIDVLIWPHAVKIWCGQTYTWVRTWQFLDRRWFTFEIHHVFPVRVLELQSFLATVTPTMGLGAVSANAKNDKNSEVYLPPLEFGVRRYFAPILETQESFVHFIQDLIWKSVVDYIPASYLDGVFDAPQPVQDVRNQDSILYHVRETVLSRTIPDEPEINKQEPEVVAERRASKPGKDKEVKKKIAEVPKVKYEIKLSGDTILSGAGRIVCFESVGNRPADLGEVIVLISSRNLPAQDDLPVMFVNIDTLFDVPVEEFKKLRITQLYTVWKLGEEEHSSELQILKNKTDVKFNDHHAMPIPYGIASAISAPFLDNYFSIQLRGIQERVKSPEPLLFGYDKHDKNFGSAPPPTLPDDDPDILIAITKIDGRALVRHKGISSFLRGEYSLFPPHTAPESLQREAACSNDINGIKTPIKPRIVVPAHVILDAQMTMEVSIGFVGCRPPRMETSFSKMFCLIRDTDIVMALVKRITEINGDLAASKRKDELLTGFALDVGDVVIFYLEGLRHGPILQIWEMTEDFYPHVKPIFSTSSRYSSRTYPLLLTATVPFIILKMHAPLSALLACPPVYARPAVPILARAAVLKFGRLVAGKMTEAPSMSQMPTAAEFNSFRLELCVPPRPTNVAMTGNPLTKFIPQALPLLRSSSHNVGRINWNK